MMETLTELIEFVENRRLGNRMAVLDESIGRKKLRVVGLLLLQWIKNQAIFDDKSPRPCNPKSEWVQDIARCFAADEELASLFVLADNSFDFHPELDEVARDKVRAFVDENYHPILYD